MDISNESTTTACGEVFSKGDICRPAPLSPVTTALQADDQPRPRLIVSGDGNRPPGIPPRLVVHRDVEPHDVAAKLRGMLGLDPRRPVPGEQAATFDRELPPFVSKLDAGGWIAWCLAGLPLFGGAFPRAADVRREAKRVLLVLALLREHSISGAGMLLGSNRKIVRENMKALGLYPWPAAMRRVLVALRGHGAETEVGDATE